MKKLPLYFLFSSFFFISCKKERTELIGPKAANDTIAITPTYWCVQSAVLKIGNLDAFHYRFEYDDSQLKTTYIYGLSYNGIDTISTRILQYRYEDGNLMHITSTSTADSVAYEETSTYQGGKLNTVSNNGYFDGAQEPAFIQYTYDGASILTKTTSTFLPDMITTSYHVFADSTIAEISYASSIDTSNPGYVVKEKLYPSSGLVILNKEKAFGALDTVQLSSVRNLVDPIIWEQIFFYKPYVTYTYYQMQSQVLDVRRNPFFIDHTISNGQITNYHYAFDGQGRMIQVNDSSLVLFGQEPQLEKELILYY